MHSLHTSAVYRPAPTLIIPFTPPALGACIPLRGRCRGCTAHRERGTRNARDRLAIRSAPFSSSVALCRCGHTGHCRVKGCSSRYIYRWYSGTTPESRAPGEVEAACNVFPGAQRRIEVSGYYIRRFATLLCFSRLTSLKKPLKRKF